MKNPAIDLSFAKDESPSPQSTWLNTSEEERLSQIKSALDVFDPEWEKNFSLLSARSNGFVTFEFKNSIPVAIRGAYLLSIESHLKNVIEEAITLWIAPVGDKSSLRNLRGIEVKK